MTRSPFRCAWCLADVPTPTSACACCRAGRDPDGSCAHRTGSTIQALFKAGVRAIRREPWAEGSYLELQAVGGFLSPIALVRSPLAWAQIPEAVKRDAGAVGLWMTPLGGWERYSGPLVDDQGDGTDLFTIHEPPTRPDTPALER